MSLPTDGFLLAAPSQLLNALALAFVLVGGLVLLGTRWREQLRPLRVTVREARRANREQQRREARINRQFYRFGAGCLVFGVLISALSSQL